MQYKGTLLFKGSKLVRNIGENFGRGKKSWETMQISPGTMESNMYINIILGHFFSDDPN